MEYDVLISFTDGSDKGAPKGTNVYWAGKSTYPRAGYAPPAARLAYLQGNTNRFKRPVIAPRKAKGPTPKPEPKK